MNEINLDDLSIISVNILQCNLHVFPQQSCEEAIIKVRGASMNPQSSLSQITSQVLYPLVQAAETKDPKVVKVCTSLQVRWFIIPTLGCISRKLQLCIICLVERQNQVSRTVQSCVKIQVVNILWSQASGKKFLVESSFHIVFILYKPHSLTI